MVVCIALGVDDVSRGNTVGNLLQHNRVVSFALQLVLRLFGQLQEK